MRRKKIVIKRDSFGLIIRRFTDGDKPLFPTQLKQSCLAMTPGQNLEPSGGGRA
ncbi:hypothetical protein APY03_0470 [Variovorax sp. WDL1]|nr:hypothetical protein APY03_0470 [Variovorax sp. WDL1]